MTATLDEFYREYIPALERGNAALFVGAGLSKAIGLKDWREFLRDIADEVGLEVDRETDLLSLAQFHVNRNQGNRHRINQRILNEFTEDVEPSENHRLIADLPLSAIWTTNYDPLIEDTLEAAGKRVDVKRRTKDLPNYLSHRDSVLYKMHGDATLPDEAILTKDDYIKYYATHQPFLDALKVDLTQKRFLFLGFSFTDPNIDWVVHRLWLTYETGSPVHYCLMRSPQRADYKKKADYDYETRKFVLRCEDLARYGIKVVVIENYGTVTEILQELKRRSRGKDIFISGSAFDYSPLGQPQIERLSRRLGQEIIKQGYNLVSGYGLGIGGAVIIGAMETLSSEKHSDISRRTTLRPFPQYFANDTERKEFFTHYRQEMISNAGFCVFLSGNKDSGDGKTSVIADGVLEEFRIARSLEKYPIPIGATGHAAREIWEEVNSHLKDIFSDVDVRREFAILGNEHQPEEKLIEAVFHIIKKTTSKRNRAVKKAKSRG